MADSPRALMLFDGVCVFCSGAARFVLDRDRAGQIDFCAMQSPAGQAMLRRLGLPLTGFETFAIFENDRLYIKSEGILRLAALMPWPWPLAGIFRLMPRRARDWLYTVLARNRYRLSGRRTECVVPPVESRYRFFQILDDLPSVWKPRTAIGCGVRARRPIGAPALSLRPEWNESSDLYGVIGLLRNLLPLALIYGCLPYLANHGASLAWSTAPLIGLLMYRLTIVMHDCLHGTLFRSSGNNRLVGEFLGAVSGISFERFRELHFEHHRHYGKANDP